MYPSVHVQALPTGQIVPEAILGQKKLLVERRLKLLHYQYHSPDSNKVLWYYCLIVSHSEMSHGKPNPTCGKMSHLV